MFAGALLALKISKSQGRLPAAGAPWRGVSRHCGGAGRGPHAAGATRATEAPCEAPPGQPQPVRGGPRGSLRDEALLAAVLPNRANFDGDILLAKADVFKAATPTPRPGTKALAPDMEVEVA